MCLDDFAHKPYDAIHKGGHLRGCFQTRSSTIYCLLRCCVNYGLLWASKTIVIWWAFDRMYLQTFSLGVVVSGLINNPVVKPIIIYVYEAHIHMPLCGPTESGVLRYLSVPCQLAPSFIH